MSIFLSSPTLSPQVQHASAQISVSGIFSYPIKSAAGVAWTKAEVGVRGLEYDRRFMVVDRAGKLATQRTVPRLAGVQADRTSTHLYVTGEDLPKLTVPIQENYGTTWGVRLWGDAMAAETVSEEASAWFSRYLGGDYQLVFMPDTTFRPMNEQFPDTALSFVDGNPFHLVSEASLTDLNRRLDTPVPMDRFRPNLVVNGCAAYEEDTWKRVRIGSLLLIGAGPTARCMMIGVDQKNAEWHKEPLKTLAAYRRVGREVHFGRHFVHTFLSGEERCLHLGNQVEVLERY
ncbi:MOSC domain-containing protein [soil metagenome]